MKIDNMDESRTRDDPLTRIQREIIEVTERENEFKKVHPTYGRNLSESELEFDRKLTNGHTETCKNEQPKTITRAYSTSHLIHSSNQTTQPQKLANGNGISRRYMPNNNQRGMMQRFIASKGKLNIAPMNATTNLATKQPYVHMPVTTPAIISKTDGKPIRKGFVPVEEKIQKELKDLKDRELELKKQRRKSSSYQLDFSSLDDSDKEVAYYSDDDETAPGPLKPTKSIGELYESLQDNYSPSPTHNGSGPESYHSLKPAKSLAELCEFAPGEQALAPSSTKLIAKWESLIQQKQESGAA